MRANGRLNTRTVWDVASLKERGIMRFWSMRGFAVGVAIVAGACSGSATAPAGDGNLTVILSITPAANATGISTSSPITITFSRPMLAGMELLVTLHEGTIVGPPVAGTFSWSSDHTFLTFAPLANLNPGTTYVLHLSPNLRDATGRGVGFAACAQRVGGQPVSPGLMTGGRMGGGNGAGMMGAGWQAGTGMWGYGMSFTFTTA